MDSPASPDLHAKQLVFARTSDCVYRRETLHMTTSPLALVRQMLCGILVAAAATLGPIQVARAELIATDAVLPSPATAARAELQAVLERTDVRAELQQLGIEPSEASARVASLSDAEVIEVQGRLSELPAGEGFVEAVAGVLIVTVAVLVFTDLLGYTDVFPFIRPLDRPRAAGEPEIDSEPGL